MSDALTRIAEALERLAPPPASAADWATAPAFVHDQRGSRAVERMVAPSLDLLRGIDAQKALVTANINRLAQGHAAHDMLLWGARGMGKSALLRASVRAAQAAHDNAIALVQVAPDALASLAPLFAALGRQERRFLVFIDDLGGHHTSVAQEAPDVWRLHLVGEPAIADKIASARHAHARIDHWSEAKDWILARLAENIPAPAPVAV